MSSVASLSFASQDSPLQAAEPQTRLNTTQWSINITLNTIGFRAASYLKVSLIQFLFQLFKGADPACIDAGHSCEELLMEFRQGMHNHWMSESNRKKRWSIEKILTTHVQDYIADSLMMFLFFILYPSKYPVIIKNIVMRLIRVYIDDFNKSIIC